MGIDLSYIRDNTRGLSSILGEIRPTDTRYMERAPTGPAGRILCSRCGNEVESDPPEVVIWEEHRPAYLWIFCDVCAFGVEAIRVSQEVTVVEALIRIAFPSEVIGSPLGAANAQRVLTEAVEILTAAKLAKPAGNRLELRPRSWDAPGERWRFGPFASETGPATPRPGGGNVAEPVVDSSRQRRGFE